MYVYMYMKVHYMYVCLLLIKNTCTCIYMYIYTYVLYLTWGDSNGWGFTRQPQGEEGGCIYPLWFTSRSSAMPFPCTFHVLMTKINEKILGGEMYMYMYM